MTVGDRIRKRRLDLGLTQEELATRLGYKHKSSINKIELGQHNMTQSKIVALADALETTPSYIMGWDDEDEADIKDDNLKRFTDAISNMTESEQEELENYMKFIISKRK